MKISLFHQFKKKNPSNKTQNGISVTFLNGLSKLGLSKLPSDLRIQVRMKGGNESLKLRGRGICGASTPDCKLDLHPIRDIIQSPANPPPRFTNY